MNYDLYEYAFGAIDNEYLIKRGIKVPAVPQNDRLYVYTHDDFPEYEEEDERDFFCYPFSEYDSITKTFREEDCAVLFIIPLLMEEDSCSISFDLVNFYLDYIY